MLPDIIKPYVNHPLVEAKEDWDLENLDNEDLNNIIRAEDQIIRGVREFYLQDASKTSRLTPGQFSSSILIARGLAFLDVAHYKNDVMDICNDVWKISPTTAKRSSFNTNIKTSIIPRLMKGGIIQFDSSNEHVENYMPYAVGSKYFVQKNLLENTKLFYEQSNHYHIIGSVQDFPELTSTIETETERPENFKRDFNALNEIDVIRTQEVKGRNFTFSRDFLTGEQSQDAWLQVLDTTDNIRVGFKHLMELQGKLGGFMSYQEILQATGWNHRLVSRLMRSVDTLGFSKRTHTLDMEDALTRATTGTHLNMNYHELNNAQAILVLIRSVPETVDILYRFQRAGEVSEDDLLEEFESTSVQKIRNSLSTIGLISQKDYYEGVWKLVPYRENDKFLNDVLAIGANTRHVLEPDCDITKEQFKGITEEKLHKETTQIKLDFYKIVDDEMLK